MLKKAKLSILGLVIFCFLLPWVNVSCGGQKIASFNGFQLVGGTTIEGKRIDGQPLAVMVLVVILGGIGLVFLDSNIGCGGAGAFGALLMLWLKYKIGQDVWREGRGVIQVDFSMGFYLALFSLLAVAGMSVYQIYGTGPPILGSTNNLVVSHFCENCGSKQGLEDHFCSECGNRNE